MEKVKVGNITKCLECKGQLEWRTLKTGRYIKREFITPYCPKCKIYWVED